MSTRATFDAATLADAVTKAARVSPTKGPDHDTMAGIVLKVNPVINSAEIMAGTRDVTYFQKLVTTDAKGDEAAWRIPAAMLAGLVSQLPMGAGATVQFIDRGDKAIRIVAGTVKVKITLIEMDGYPTIKPFPTDEHVPANEFAKKVAQVAWATAKDNSILSGVHVNGTHLVGCDRNVAALVPCTVGITNPVTVPLSTLSSILKTATDVGVEAVDRRLHIMLDSESQASTTIIEGAYPNVDGLRRTNYAGKCVIPKTAFVESLERLLVVARSERLPACTFTFTPGLMRTLVLDLETDDAHRIQDTIDVSGDFDEPFTVGFTPTYILPAIQNSKEEMITLEYGGPDPAKAALLPCRITDTSGYEVLIATRRKVNP